ncbi:carotenoid oxygenase family protein [Kitasatospora sp. NPDC085464]|uniref:carotenoid oxygenase family protein n=1 Tax=Kitasatospora sp. NPDC085464 TaxID=3364063 RepID=UPI0037CA4D36
MFAGGEVGQAGEVVAGLAGGEDAEEEDPEQDVAAGVAGTVRTRTPGEAVFVPAGTGTPVGPGAGSAGSPGWLMTYVHDARTERSDLVVLAADDLAAPPVATVHLPARVPFGFHGNWLADAPA